MTEDRVYHKFYLLTDKVLRTGLFLTLITVTSGRADICQAADNYNEVNVTARTSATVADTLEQHKRLGLVMDYVRHEATHWLPGIPRALTSTGKWVAGNLSSLAAEFDFQGVGDAENGIMTSVVTPVMSMIEAPTIDQNDAMWVTPNYHHKGFLPTKDAIIMGVNMRRGLMQNRMRFEVKPFYGQNPISTRGYWGSAVSININEPIGIFQSGNVTISYIGGDSRLSDHGRGIDLHSDLKFNDHLGLEAGMRQDNNEKTGDYVMVRWAMPLN
jgi:hypothetical protein